jgi:heme/copper-type cytochrome/quinol oxidase subunit 2
MINDYQQGNNMDFFLNILIWVGVVIFAVFFIGFLAAVKLNKRQDDNDQSTKNKNPNN